MSESMSSPWIRDYLVDVAETYGAQVHNAPVSNKKKKVQLTDLLTYQEDSYVWAFISDKDHRVSVRISKDAVDGYKGVHGRSVLNSRFFLVSISSYRPMFSPRPLGPNTVGKTPVSHISLEVSCLSQIGIGGHLFGNPRDLETDENMREWASGLRQDGGGGNVLKLRKQQKIVQNEKKSPSLPSPPLQLSPALQHQKPKAAKNAAAPKPEQIQDLKRAYAKRWRKVEVDQWKFSTKPVEEQPTETELDHSPVEPLLGAAKHVESRGLLPASPPRAPSPISLQRQGTPTDWSLSDRGGSVAPDETNISALGNVGQQHDESEVLPTTPRIPSDTEGHTLADTAITSDTRSLQPPTPAQRVRCSPIRRSFSPSRNSPEPLAHSSPHPSQQLPCSSPPPPSSSLPFPSSSLPMPVGIRKNIQRKVPHPGLLFSRPDPIKQGPVQILVPNSDTSGTGSSQSYLQSQPSSESQQQQSQLPSHTPIFPSSLAKEFNPADASTPKVEKLVSTPIRTSKISTESSPIHGGINEQESTSVDAAGTAHTNTGKQGPALPPASTEVPEVGKSDTNGETKELQLTHGVIQAGAELGAHVRTHDAGEGNATPNHSDSRSSVDKVQPAPTLVIQHPSPNRHDTEVPISCSTQLTEHPGSRSPLHSLFSESLEDERPIFSRGPISSAGRAKDKLREEATPTQAPRHDSEAWKEPSFITKSKEKGKARAVEEPDTPNTKVGRKRRRSAQHESPLSKRMRVVAPEVRGVAPDWSTTETPGCTRPRDTEASTIKKTHLNNRPPASPADSAGVAPPPPLQLPKPRLANFVVDFERADLQGVPIPKPDLLKDIKSMLLRTGRIRTLGEEVEKDGSVYIMR